MKITEVKLRKSFTSRGDETVEATVVVGGFSATATAPAGASTGKHEVVHLPQGGANAAIESFNTNQIIGVEAGDLKAVHDALVAIDGSDSFSRIGGATAFAVSVAALFAGAKADGVPAFTKVGLRPQMPFPLGNVLGGGKHAGPGAPDIQEFLSSPVGAKSVLDAVQANIMVHRQVLRLIEKKDPSFAGGKGDEGAWAANLSNRDALELVRTAIDSVSKELGFRIIMGVDMASSSFYSNGKYVYRREGKSFDRNEQLAFVEDIIRKYDLKYVEDPFNEEDFEMFAELRKSVSSLIVGDDLFVTNYRRLEKGVKIGAGNGVILKVNQVGTVYMARLFAETALKAGYTVITSHRSGDTCDSYLAHLAVGFSSGLMKSGVIGGERMSKLIELSRINEEHREVSLWRSTV